MNTSGRRRGGPRRHRPGDPETYALGEWPVLEALRHRPRLVREVLLHPTLRGERRERLERSAAAAGVACRDDERTLHALRHRSDARALALVRTEDDALRREHDHLALLGTRAAGNLGVVLRSALGFDLRDVALIGSPLDPWSPHVLRASQGARFALRVERFSCWDDYRASHVARDLAWFAAPRPGSERVPLSALQLARPATLAFGPEWHDGDAAPPPTSTAVGIPQHPDLESHNLAVAVAIALYALHERRDARPAAC